MAFQILAYHLTMKLNQYISRVVDLTCPEKNIIYNMSHEEAVEIVKSGDPGRIREIDGQFALISTEGKSVHMARSIGRPIRYFIAKLEKGPCLVVGERIDAIYNHLKSEGLEDQFHPSYTRMAPAHYITKIQLLGCPDPNPEYERFFTPERNSLQGSDPIQIGTLYMEALYDEIVKWLTDKGYHRTHWSQFFSRNRQWICIPAYLSCPEGTGRKPLQVKSLYPQCGWWRRRPDAGQEFPGVTGTGIVP